MVGSGKALVAWFISFSKCTHLALLKFNLLTGLPPMGWTKAEVVINDSDSGAGNRSRVVL